MKRCLECGFLFEEPKEYDEDLTPGGAFEGGSFVRKYTGCPICGGAYNNLEQCECCGEYFDECDLKTTNDLKKCCLECIEENDYEY